MSRIPSATIAEVDERRGGYACEATGASVLHVSYHHRRPYRMGGRGADVDGLQNHPANILGLCGKHHAWAHAAGPDDPHGFMLHDGQDPREVPVRPDPRLGRCGA